MVRECSSKEMIPELPFHGELFMLAWLEMVSIHSSEFIQVSSSSRTSRYNVNCKCIEFCTGGFTMTEVQEVVVSITSLVFFCLFVRFVSESSPR